MQGTMSSVDLDNCELPRNASAMGALPALPSDVARLIFEHLGMKDLCGAARSCKAFWNYTCHVTSLTVAFKKVERLERCMKSFTKFLSKRLPLGLEVTHSFTPRSLLAWRSTFAFINKLLQVHAD